MEPTLRYSFIEMMPRLEAEEAIRQAQITRVAYYKDEAFKRQISQWQELAHGKVVGQDMDRYGRPMTDNLDEFIKFYSFDRNTLKKHGVV